MERLSRHPRRILVAALVLAAAVVALLAAHAGFDAVIDAFAPFRGSWIAVAFGAQILAFAGYTLAYRSILTALDGPRLEPSLVARLVMAGFGAFAPGGGFAIDYRAVKTLEDDTRNATVRVLALGALEYLVIAPAACIAAITMLALGSSAIASVLWPWAIAVPAGFAIGFSAVAKRKLIVRGRSGKGWRVLADTLAGIDMTRQMAARPLRFAPALAGIAGYWAGEVLSLWACVRAMDASLDAAALIVGLATGYALTRRSMPLAGAGVTELLLTLALTWVGLGFATAVATMVLYRLLSFVLPMLPALWARQGIVHLIDPGEAATARIAGSSSRPAAAPRAP